MNGHNPGINRLDSEWTWPKVKATRGQNHFCK